LHQSEVDNAARLIREKEQAGNAPEQVIGRLISSLPPSYFCCFLVFIF
jgi:hypothetical protein